MSTQLRAKKTVAPPRARWFYSDKGKMWKTYGKDSNELERQYQAYLSDHGHNMDGQDFEPVNVKAFGGKYSMEFSEEKNRFLLVSNFTGEPDVLLVRGTHFRKLADKSSIPIEHSQSSIVKALEGRLKLLVDANRSFRSNESNFMAIPVGNRIWDVSFVNEHKLDVKESNPQRWWRRHFTVLRGFNESIDEEESGAPIENLVLIVHGLGKSVCGNKIFEHVECLSRTISRVNGKHYPDLGEPTVLLPVTWTTTIDLKQNADTNEMMIIDYRANKERIKKEVTDQFIQRFQQLQSMNKNCSNTVTVIGMSFGAKVAFDAIRESTLPFKVNTLVAVGSMLSFFLDRDATKETPVMAMLDNLKFRVINLFNPQDPLVVATMMDPLRFDYETSPLSVRAIVKNWKKDKLEKIATRHLKGESHGSAKVKELWDYVLEGRKKKKKAEDGLLAHWERWTCRNPEFAKFVTMIATGKL